ncbi:unnamed protein product, partial [Citrullus colocynthis]
PLVSLFKCTRRLLISLPSSTEEKPRPYSKPSSLLRFPFTGDRRTSPESLFLAGNYGVFYGRLRCRYGLSTLTVSGFRKRKRLYLAEFRSYSIFCLEN